MRIINKIPEFFEALFSSNFVLIRLFPGTVFCLTGLWALFKPAGALRCCALALPLMTLCLLWPFRKNIPDSFKGLFLMLPFFTALLWLRTFWDTAALWSVAFVALRTGHSSLQEADLTGKFAAVAAFAAGAVLLWQSFTADWFAILPAVILTLLGAGFKELVCAFSRKKS